jgi:hypothetical protein
MEQEKLAASVAIVLMLVMVAVVGGVTTWQQVNSSGFGEPQASEVSAIESFNGYLYAGTGNATDGARIFRSQDGQTTWNPVTDPGFGIPHDTRPPAILDLTVFGGRLYASTGRGDGPGQIWRSLNGLSWGSAVVNDGFHDPDTVDITALAVYDGLIYAGAANLVNGAQIWRSYTGDSNSWEQVAPAVPGTDMAHVTALAEFDGALYAAITSEAPPQIWRSYGGAWETILNDGFGDANTVATGGMAEFAGYLYVGAASAVDGAQIWRSHDGENWEQIITPGFADAHNERVDSLFVFQNRLYAGVTNTITGIEVWQSTNGAFWEQVNDDGFGDANNATTNGSNATTNFAGRLYVGTSNVVDGGELWQMTPAVSPVYGVVLSPDDSKSGLPDTTVTYAVTITNSGNMSDTFNLALDGNAWAAALSTSVVTLPAGVTGSFTISVTIPTGAAHDAGDVLTVIATSQGDSRVSDSVILTTRVLPAFDFYLPMIVRSAQTFTDK